MTTLEGVGTASPSAVPAPSIRSWQRPSIRLIGITLAVSLVLTAIGVGLAWRNYQDERARVIEQTEFISRAAAADTDLFLRNNLELLKLVASAPAVRTSDIAAMQAYLALNAPSQASLQRVSWLDLDGFRRAGTAPEPAGTPLFAGDREYFQMVTATRQPYVSAATISRLDNRPVVLFAVPTFSVAGPLNGVLIASIPLDQLEETLANFRLGEAGATLVIDRSGQLIVDSATATDIIDVARAPLAVAARANGRGVAVGVAGVQGEANRLVAYAPAPTGDWVVMIDRSAGEALNPARRTLFGAAAGLGAISLVGVLAAVFVGRRLDALTTGQQQALAESESLREVASVISSRLKSDDVLQLIAREARELFRADVASVGILEHRDAPAVWRAVVGARTDQWYQQSAPRSGSSRRAVSGRRPVVMTGFDPDNPQHPDMLIHIAERFRTSLLVPLVRDNRSYGVLMLGWRADRAFDERELQLAEALAASATIALDNARLYEERLEIDRQKDEFLAVVSHDLRTPLTSIKGHAQLLLRRAERAGVPDASASLAIIESQADRLGRLVRDLLDVSRIEAGQLELEPEPLDAADLARRLVHERQQTSDAHAFRYTAAVEPLVVVADPDRLTQVLANLLDNAVKYSPAGGAIEVTARIVANEAELAVRDHGMGIPEEARTRLFERYYRATNVSGVPGLGLGLYISHRLTEAHGGRLWAEGPTDGGSRFVLRLPLAPAHVTLPCAFAIVDDSA